MTNQKLDLPLEAEGPLLFHKPYTADIKIITHEREQHSFGHLITHGNGNNPSDNGQQHRSK